MKLIPLSKTGANSGKYFAQVDDEDYDLVNSFNWSVQKTTHTEYAIRSIYPNGKLGGSKTIYLHRFILGVDDPNIEVDHKDHNGLNCQKYNIRESTFEQNMSNRKSRHGSTSKYVGVHRGKTGWIAVLYVGRKRVFRKQFNDEIKAAIARDCAALEYKGEFAYLNFKTK